MFVVATISIMNVRVWTILLTLVLLWIKTEMNVQRVYGVAIWLLKPISALHRYVTELGLIEHGTSLRTNINWNSFSERIRNSIR